MRLSWELFMQDPNSYPTFNSPLPPEFQIINPLANPSPLTFPSPVNLPRSHHDPARATKPCVLRRPENNLTGRGIWRGGPIFVGHQHQHWRTRAASAWRAAECRRLWRCRGVFCCCAWIVRVWGWEAARRLPTISTWMCAAANSAGPYRPLIKIECST